MWNIFKRPVNQESLESWVKILDDIAKVAILAMPVVVYGEKAVGFKIGNVILLIISAYMSLSFANFLRQRKSELTGGK